MRTESGAEKRDEALKFISAMLVALACGFFLAVMQPLSKSAPYSDDWSFIGAAGLGPEGVLRWSLQPHNEHFIPIMKLVQYAVLRVALFDFRPLIAINAMVAAAASVAAFYVARAYRGGKSVIGDLFFPLLLLNSAFNVFAWGFSAQFGWAVAASFVFLAFLSAGIARGSVTFLVLAHLALLTLGLTGLNGMVVAGTAATVLTMGALLARGSTMRWPVATLGGTAWLLLASTYFATRVDGTTPLGGTDLGGYADWAYNLLKSSLVIRAEPGGRWRAALLGCLALAALLACLVSVGSALRRRPVRLFDIGLQGVFLGYLALLSAVVLGRSGLGPWMAGLELHYGYLAAPVPILGWIIVSRLLKRPLSAALGLALLLLFADAFWAGTRWRLDYLQVKREEFEELSRLLASGAPAEEVTARHMREIYWLDTPELRRELVPAIEKYQRLIRR